LRARLCRFPLCDCGWRKAYPKLDAFHEKMLTRPSVKVSVATAGLIAGSCHESHAQRRAISHHRIIEQETPFLPALEMLPGLTRTCCGNRAWMREAPRWTPKTC